MEVSSQRRHLLIFSALTVASILIFQISIVFFLFSIPLFIIFRRYGIRYLSMASLFVSLVIVIQTIIRAAGIEGKALRDFLIIAELIYPLALIGGVLLVSYFGNRILYLFLAATAGFALLSFPVFFHYSGNTEIVNLIKNQIISVSDMFRNAASTSDSFESSVLLKELSPDLIIESTKKLVFRNYLFIYYLMISGSWFIAEAIHRKSIGTEKFKLINFRVPDSMLWPLIVILGGVLLDVFIGIPWLGYLLWNSTFILIFMYGLHGIGLLKYIFEKYKVPSRGRRFIVIATFAVVFIPGINLVVLLGIPVLGISELWIKYRV